MDKQQTKRAVIGFLLFAGAGGILTWWHFHMFDDPFHAGSWQGTLGFLLLPIAFLILITGLEKSRKSGSEERRVSEVAAATPSSTPEQSDGSRAAELVEKVIYCDWPPTLDEYCKELIGLGPAAVGPLINALETRTVRDEYGSEMIGFKCAIVNTLAGIGTVEAISALRRQLMRPDDNTTNIMNLYETATRALLRIENADAQAALDAAQDGPAGDYVRAIRQNG